MTTEQSDDELMALLVAGNSVALGQLYDRYGTGVYSLILYMLGGDRSVTEELVQETFVRVWRQATLYTAARGALGTWVHGIARNLAIDELRRRRTRPQATGGDAADALEALADGAADPAEQVSTSMQHAVVSTALSQLPEAQRVVLELAYFRGLSQSEIAQRLGDPLGTIKTRMRLGLRKLKSILEADEAGLELF